MTGVWADEKKPREIENDGSNGKNPHLNKICLVTVGGKDRNATLKEKQMHVEPMTEILAEKKNTSKREWWNQWQGNYMRRKTRNRENYGRKNTVTGGTNDRKVTENKKQEW